MQPVGNVRRAGAPRKGGNAESPGSFPWGSALRHLRRSSGERTRGAQEREMLSCRPGESKPGRRKSSGEQGLHPVPNPDRRQDVRLVLPAHVAEASAKGGFTFCENAGAGRTRETAVGRQGRRKALKSEAQERGELKEASESGRADTAERVAKPWGRGLWKAWQGFPDVRRLSGEKRGSSVSTC
jgi:hypothetical protein